MHHLIIIRKEGAGYVRDVRRRSKVDSVYGLECGSDPYDAAVETASFMQQCLLDDPDGCYLIAPPEVLEHIPADLRKPRGSKP